MRLVMLALVLGSLFATVGRGNASVVGLPSLPVRGAKFSPDAWGTYTRIVLTAGYPEHTATIKRLTVAIDEQDSRVFIGIEPDEEKPRLIMTRGLIDSIRSPEEFQLICGHELGHVVSVSPPRFGLLYDDLALRGLHPKELLRIARDEMIADLFAALELDRDKVSEGICGMRNAHEHLFRIWSRNPEYDKWASWVELERNGLLDRWCSLAVHQEEKMKLKVAPEVREKKP